MLRIILTSMLTLLTATQGYNINTEEFSPTKYFCTQSNKFETTEYYLAHTANLNLPKVWKRISNIGECNVECQPCETLKDVNQNIILGFRAHCNNIDNDDIQNLNLINQTSYHQAINLPTYKNFITESVNSPLNQDGIYEAVPDDEQVGLYISKYTICLKSENKIKLITRSTNNNNLNPKPTNKPTKISYNKQFNNLTTNNTQNEVYDELDEDFDNVTSQNQTSNFTSHNVTNIKTNYVKLNVTYNSTPKDNSTFDNYDEEYDDEYNNNSTSLNKTIKNMKFVNKNSNKTNQNQTQDTNFDDDDDENYQNTTVNQTSKTHSPNSSSISSRMASNPTFNQNSSSVPNSSQVTGNSVKSNIQIIRINKESNVKTQQTQKNTISSTYNPSANTTTNTYKDETIDSSVYPTRSPIISNQTILVLMVIMFVVVILTFALVIYSLVYKLCYPNKDVKYQQLPNKEPSDTYIY